MNLMGVTKKEWDKRTVGLKIVVGIDRRLLFGVNEKLLTQHISGPVTKYKLL